MLRCSLQSGPSQGSFQVCARFDPLKSKLSKHFIRPEGSFGRKHEVFRSEVFATDLPTDFHVNKWEEFINMTCTPSTLGTAPAKLPAYGSFNNSTWIPVNKWIGWI